MLFTHVKLDEIQGPHIEHVKCEKCSETGFHLWGKVKYLAFELMDVPMFVINKKYEFRCDCGHCQPPCLKPKQLRVLKRQMLPWTYFAAKHMGIVVLMLFAAMTWNDYQQAREIEYQLVSEPRINDFYFVDYFAYDDKSHPKYRYTVLKATEVDEHNVTLQVGNIFRSRKGNARDQIKSDRAMLDGFFSKNSITLSRDELTAMVSQETIYEVRRPKNLQIDGWIVIPPGKVEEYQHHVNPDNQEGIALYRGEDGYYRDYEGAFAAFTKAALADDAAGQLNLAEMYRDGLGTQQNHQKALQWFKAAADKDYSNAQHEYEQLCARSLSEYCVRNEGKPI